MKTSLVYIFSFLIIAVIGLIGRRFTGDHPDTDWYQCIKPEISPPNWTYGVVWTIIYILVAIALGKTILTGNKILIGLFVINLVLNSVWTYYFFTKKRLDISLAVISFLSLTIILILNITKDNSIKMLMVPYLAWVIFAQVLNILALSKSKECKPLINQ